MKNIFLFFLTILFVSTFTYGQNEIELYKRIYKTADSLKAIGKNTTIDTVSLYKKINDLDKKNPTVFFEATGNYLTASKFNEAAFIYYLGVMRFRYYNSVNPDYKASGDGALLNSLQYVMGEPINMYLKTDIDNFIAIIKLTVSYYENNDFTFFSREKNIEKYNAQIKSYNNLISELEEKKEIYREQWDTESKTMKDNIDRNFKDIKLKDISSQQNTLNGDSKEFCGKYFVPPSECETLGNMIKCNDYAFMWLYEPVSDLPRHKRELLGQLSKPKKIKVAVLNKNLVGYLSKMDVYQFLLIIGEVNEKGVIISLYLNKEIKTTKDLPECVRQLITIKT